MYRGESREGGKFKLDKEIVRIKESVTVRLSVIGIVMIFAGCARRDFQISNQQRLNSGFIG